MEPQEYKKMYEMEEKYWWYVGRRSIVKNCIKPSEHLSIIDVGCGTCFNLDYLKDFGIPMGLDFSKDVLALSKKRGVYDVINADIRKIPLKSKSFDLVTCLDVLEHVDDSMALNEINRIMKLNAILIITVPVFNFLWSNQDNILHHKRRYSIKELKKTLSSKGFVIEKISYWNFFLFPLIFLIIYMNNTIYPNRKENIIKVIKLPEIINALFTQILKTESFLISQNINLPFGVSAICVCKKKANI
ncbi:MAG: class I SAM-dependent methyltransferase [Candidatus Aenigmarchaeota archaeon]|nr:class I SAM-dependent methyltransferase [Candidatus Aenigmarchaeota archaeon]